MYLCVQMLRLGFQFQSRIVRITQSNITFLPLSSPRRQDLQLNGFASTEIFQQLLLVQGTQEGLSCLRFLRTYLKDVAGNVSLVGNGRNSTAHLFRLVL